MCLLNGDVSGSLFAAHEFSTIYTQHKDGTITKDKIPIYNIIKEAVHTYAQEPYSNIVINDLDSCGVELIDYICDDSIMYIFEQRIRETDPWVQQICFSGSYMADQWELLYTNTNEQSWDLYLDLDGIHYHLLKRIDPETDVDTTAGYRATDLIYPEDLVVSVGGNITSMLDSIIKMLGEFEYFYDIDGRFIFQRKKIYFNSSWSNAITTDNETYYDSIANNSEVAYSFSSAFLIESFQNKPELKNIRNDYAVWGKRKNSSGQEATIHLRYAIDKKPTTYWSLLEKRLYVSNEYQLSIVTDFKRDNSGDIQYNIDGTPFYETTTITGEYDWRELLYQMARDNLRATVMVQALTRAIATGYYHYDYSRIKNYVTANNIDYTICYKYNDLEHKFEKLQKQKDTEGLEENEIETIKGQKAFEDAKANNVPLFGPDSTLALWTLTEDNIKNIEYTMRVGSDATGGRSYPDYNYNLNNYNNKYYNIIYDYDLSDEQKTERLDELTQFQLDEQNVIAYYTEGNLLEDMRREIDEWSDTFNTGYDAYYADMLAFWPLIYRTSNSIEFAYDENGNIELDESGNPKYTKSNIEQKEWRKWCLNHYWNPHLMTYNTELGCVQFKNPEMLQFWIDFLDESIDGRLWQYSVPVIGRRSKSINDDKVKAIYFRDTPMILFVSEDYEPVEGEENLHYVRINIAPPISNYFQISAQGKSAKSVLDSMLYEGTYYQESITLSVIPIYYLEPNTRISVVDETTGINGQYIIKNFSLQLTYNGMMSITATRVTDTII